MLAVAIIWTLESLVRPYDVFHSVIFSLRLKEFVLEYVIQLAVKLLHERFTRILTSSSLPAVSGRKRAEQHAIAFTIPRVRPIEKTDTFFSSTRNGEKKAPIRAMQFAKACPEARSLVGNSSGWKKKITYALTSSMEHSPSQPTWPN